MSDKRLEPDFAASLGDYSVRLANDGQDEKALDFAKRALDIHQRLYLSKPEQYESVFATSLNNYAIRLAINGREIEALDFAKKALDILQPLSKNNAERFESQYANSLNVYANRLADNGHKAEALNWAKQALDIVQRLSQNKPERFMPQFAISLANYASHLSENGKEDDAFDFGRQALDIHQQLAKNKPERFESHFADSLYNHANRLSEQGKYHEAIIQQTHSHALYERHAQRIPLRYAGAEYDARLKLAFLCWLASGQAIDEVLALEVPALNPREMRKADMYRSALQCLHAAASDANLDALRICLKNALAQWYRLDAGQKNDWESSFLLLAALAHRKLGVDAAPPAWSDQLERFKRRRQGQLPRWMLDAASRCGCTLDL